MREESKKQKDVFVLQGTGLVLDIPDTTCPDLKHTQGCVKQQLKYKSIETNAHSRNRAENANGSLLTLLNNNIYKSFHNAHIVTMSHNVCQSNTRPPPPPKYPTNAPVTSHFQQLHASNFVGKVCVSSLTLAQTTKQNPKA